MSKTVEFRQWLFDNNKRDGEHFNEVYEDEVPAELQDIYRYLLTHQVISVSKSKIEEGRLKLYVKFDKLNDLIKTERDDSKANPVIMTKEDGIISDELDKIVTQLDTIIKLLQACMQATGR